MKVPIPRSIEAGLAIVLGVLVVVTITLQILTADSETSTLETSLFSILQFVFSIGFAALLARMSTRQEFTRSQRQFAIAAYRRTREIDGAVDRLIRRADSLEKDGKEAQGGVDAFREIAAGMKMSIASSIADWGDVIGEELVTVEKLDAVRRNQARAASESALTEGMRDYDSSDVILQELKSQQTEVRDLLESLPYSLQLAVHERNALETIRDDFWQELSDALRSRGGINLCAFWTPDFERDVHELVEGAEVTIRFGDVNSRIGALIAYDKEGRSLGVVTNSSDGLSYAEFAMALVHYCGKSEISASVVEIERDGESNGEERHYFDLRIGADCIDRWGLDDVPAD